MKERIRKSARAPTEIEHFVGCEICFIWDVWGKTLFYWKVKNNVVAIVCDCRGNKYGNNSLSSVGETNKKCK